MLTALSRAFSSGNQSGVRRGTRLGRVTTRSHKNKQGVCHTVALSFTVVKSILSQKKNEENSNIFAMQKYKLQKNRLKETKILQDIITL